MPCGIILARLEFWRFSKLMFIDEKLTIVWHWWNSFISYQIAPITAGCVSSARVKQNPETSNGRSFREASLEKGKLRLMNLKLLPTVRSWEIKTIDISVLQHSLWRYSFQSVLFLVSCFLFLFLLIPLLSSIPILHLNLSTIATHPSISLLYCQLSVLIMPFCLFPPLSHPFQVYISVLYFVSDSAWVPAERLWEF